MIGWLKQSLLNRNCMYGQRNKNVARILHIKSSNSSAKNKEVGLSFLSNSWGLYLLSLIALIFFLPGITTAKKQSRQESNQMIKNRQMFMIKKRLKTIYRCSSVRTQSGTMKWPFIVSAQSNYSRILLWIIWRDCQPFYYMSTYWPTNMSFKSSQIFSLPPLIQRNHSSKSHQMISTYPLKH